MNGSSSSSSSSSTGQPASTSSSSFPLLPAASGLLLVLIIYSIGWKSSILILFSTSLLLLNPWIRILLELPSTSSEGPKSSLSRFDPAYYLSSFHSEVAEETASARKEKPSEPSTKSPVQRQNKVTLAVLPPAVRERLRITIPLVVRDFVKYWYDPLTFAHPAFPKEASATIEHLCGSVYLRVKKKRTVDVASNLLLTSSSVILSALRARRTEASSNPKPPNPNSSDHSRPQPPSANPSLPPIHSWNSTSSRIQSLRSAIQRFLSIHLPFETASSTLVSSLLTEILTKQLWGVIQIIGDPDWINRKIVESSQDKTASGLGGQGLDPDLNLGLGIGRDGILSDQFNVDPLADNELLRKAQQEANVPVSLQEQVQRQAEGTQQQQRHLQEPRQTDVRSTIPTLNPSNPATGSSSINPLASVGSFGLSALGSVGRAAGKTVDVLEGAVGEVGNTLMGGEATMPGSNQNLDRSRGQPVASDSYVAHQRRKPVPLGSDQDETIKRPPSHLNSDLPPSHFREPPLPESLKRSMNSNVSNADGKRNSLEGYEIREPAGEKAPALPPRTPNLAFPSNPASKSFDSSNHPSLSSVLSRKDPETDDKFESFLENQSAGRGEALLRLHTQLQTLSQISQMSSPDEATFRADASAILEKVGVPLPKESEIAREFESTLRKLQVQGNGSMSTLDPLKVKVDQGLEQYYAYFCERQQEKRDEEKNSRLSAPITPSNPSTSSNRQVSSETPTFSMQRSHSPGLNYVARGMAPKSQAESPAPLNYTPRKKSSTTTASTSGQSGALPAEENLPILPSRPQPAASQDPKTAVTTGAANLAPAPERPAGDASLPGRATSILTSDPVRVSSPLPTASSRKQETASSVDQPSSSSSSSGLSLEVSVTDVSSTCNGPDSLVDPRTLELMVAVEGLAASGGGFVLVRRWVEFESLDIELRRSSLPSSIVPKLPNLKSKSCTSSSACQMIEAYLVKLLSSQNLIDLEVTRRFVDKTRAGAGADAESIKSKGGPKAFISGMGAFGGTLGRSVAIGASSVGAAVGNVGQNMGIGTERSKSSNSNSSSSRNPALLNAQAQAGAPNVEVSPSLSTSSSTSSSPTSGVSHSLGVSNASLESHDAGVHSKQTLDSPQLDVDISSRDLDALLSAVFSVADEAFDLSGGWTFRRGMLRVLEQIVRASYGGTIINAFNHTSQALSSESLGNHLESLTDSFWPMQKGEDSAKSSTGASDLSKRVWDSTPTPERTLQEREETSKAARMVVLSYTPVQAAFLLGPGGRTSCEKALSTIHREIENPITSLDIALILVLKMLDISCE